MSSCPQQFFFVFFSFSFSFLSSFWDPVTPRHSVVIVVDGPAFCKRLSGWASLLQMATLMGQPFANDHSDGPAFCKRFSGWAGLLQMITLMGRPFANDRSDGPANDYPDGLALCKWYSGWADLLQMTNPISPFQPYSSPFFFFQQISYFPPKNIIFSIKTFLLLLLQILGSRFKLADLSRTMCSFWTIIATWWNPSIFLPASIMPLGCPFWNHFSCCLAQMQIRSVYN